MAKNRKGVADVALALAKVGAAAFGGIKDGAVYAYGARKRDSDKAIREFNSVVVGKGGGQQAKSKLENLISKKFLGVWKSIPSSVITKKLFEAIESNSSKDVINALSTRIDRETAVKKLKELATKNKNIGTFEEFFNTVEKTLTAKDKNEIFIQAADAKMDAKVEFLLTKAISSNVLDKTLIEAITKKHTHVANAIIGSGKFNIRHVLIEAIKQENLKVAKFIFENKQDVDRQEIEAVLSATKDGDNNVRDFLKIQLVDKAFARTLYEKYKKNGKDIEKLKELIKKLIKENGAKTFDVLALVLRMTLDDKNKNMAKEILKHIFEVDDMKDLAKASVKDEESLSKLKSILAQLPAFENIDLDKLIKEINGYVSKDKIIHLLLHPLIQEEKEEHSKVLTYAARSNGLELARVLIRIGEADLQSKKAKRKTAIEIATEKGHNEILQVLKEEQKNNPKYSNNIFIRLLTKDEGVAIQTLENQDNVKDRINITDNNDTYPIIAAINKEYYKFAELLIKKGANVYSTEEGQDVLKAMEEITKKSETRIKELKAKLNKEQDKIDQQIIKREIERVNTKLGALKNLENKIVILRLHEKSSSADIRRGTIDAYSNAIKNGFNEGRYYKDIGGKISDGYSITEPFANARSNMATIWRREYEDYKKQSFNFFVPTLWLAVKLSLVTVVIMVAAPVQAVGHLLNRVSNFAGSAIDAGFKAVSTLLHAVGNYLDTKSVPILPDLLRYFGVFFDKAGCVPKNLFAFLGACCVSIINMPPLVNLNLLYVYRSFVQCIFSVFDIFIALAKELGQQSFQKKPSSDFVFVVKFCICTALVAALASITLYMSGIVLLPAWVTAPLASATSYVLSSSFVTWATASLASATSYILSSSFVTWATASLAPAAQLFAYISPYAVSFASNILMPVATTYMSLLAKGGIAAILCASVIPAPGRVIGGVILTSANALEGVLTTAKCLLQLDFQGVAAGISQIFSSYKGVFATITSKSSHTTFVDRGEIRETINFGSKVSSESYRSAQQRMQNAALSTTEHTREAAKLCSTSPCAYYAKTHGLPILTGHHASLAVSREEYQEYYQQQQQGQERSNF